MLPRAPVKKLSTQTTSWPAASRRSHRWEPRNPAPPVTSTRVGLKGIIPVIPGSPAAYIPPGRPSGAPDPKCRPSATDRAIGPNLLDGRADTPLGRTGATPGRDLATAVANSSTGRYRPASAAARAVCVVHPGPGAPGDSSTALRKGERRGRPRPGDGRGGPAGVKIRGMPTSAPECRHLESGSPGGQRTVQHRLWRARCGFDRIAI